MMHRITSLRSPSAPYRVVDERCFLALGLESKRELGASLPQRLPLGIPYLDDKHTLVHNAIDLVHETLSPCRARGTLLPYMREQGRGGLLKESTSRQNMIE